MWPTAFSFHVCLQYSPASRLGKVLTFSNCKNRREFGSEARDIILSTFLLVLSLMTCYESSGCLSSIDTSVYD